MITLMIISAFKGTKQEIAAALTLSLSLDALFICISQIGFN